jgi:hypothetical protein
MLGYILYGMFFILLICYTIDGYDYEKCHLRSISGLICTQRECGCFAMGLGNLILFEMVEHTHPVIAWIMWISAQGVLCFFLDTFPVIHHILLATYMFALVWFAITACIEISGFYVHIVPFLLFSVLFGGAVIGNHFNQKWPYMSIQSVFELLWLLSLVYVMSVHEKLHTV